jgi:hypothetical protein
MIGQIIIKMNSQFFSGDTATQTTGTMPMPWTRTISYENLLNKALGKEPVSTLTDPNEDAEELENRQTTPLIEPLLELATDVTPVEVLEAEPPVVPNKAMKKHVFNIYPEMNKEDYLALKKDIQQNGYDPKYPIWLYNGDILDGWNRQKVCSELNIIPVYQNFIGANSEALTFVIRSNKRRNLTAFQRSCIAVKSDLLIEELKVEAKERQIEGAKNKVRQKIAEPKKDDNKTVAKLAKLYNTNRTYIQKARKIRNENSEMFERMLNGEETIKKANIKGTFTGEEEWYTPKEYMEKVRLVLETIDLDPASSDFANETVKAKIFYTKITNGLDKKWVGKVYMYPPYSKEIEAFIDKLCEEIESGNVNEAIILTNNSTDTEWFRKLIMMAKLVCFTDGRVKFHHCEKKPNITHGQVFFYIGENEEGFIKHFSDVGFFMKKV